MNHPVIFTLLRGKKVRISCLLGKLKAARENSIRLRFRSNAY